MTARADPRSVLAEIRHALTRTTTIATTPSTTDTPARAVQPAAPRKEPWPEQAASFIGFFIYLLVLKTFFLPLFIIPTGSMAETLRGAHAVHTCPNCGIEYAISFDRGLTAQVICPNCRWIEVSDPARLPRDARVQPDELLAAPLAQAAGDRIFVHGWDYGPPFQGLLTRGPQRWDVVVFKVPSDGQTNYIKRLIGLPGESIEIIDGDIFADGRILRKPDDPQRSLWFPVYHHDHAPRQPARHVAYWPRWVAPDDGWTGLQSRVMRSDARGRERAELHFVTDPRDPQAPPKITDFYAYNAMYQRHNDVADVRLSAEVSFEGGDGFLELIVRKHDQRFIARLYAGGALTLERERLHGEGATRETLAEGRVDTSTPIRFGLANADYRVRVEVDGRAVLATSDAQYDISPDDARRRANPSGQTEIRFAAEAVRVALRHVLVERDVYYTSDPESKDQSDPRAPRPANGGPGNPITMGPREYFCCGDNSPNSADGRYWYPESVGPQLRAALAAGTYTAGTVPADQMIGRAFFVYWPGFMPLGPTKLSILPDFGRTRWIR